MQVNPACSGSIIVNAGVLTRDSCGALSCLRSIAYAFYVIKICTNQHQLLMRKTLMRQKILITLTFVLFLTPGLSWALDYKDWLPLLPDEIGGLKTKSKDNGVNINAGGVIMSSLTITYGEGDKKIDISISAEASGEPIKSGPAKEQVVVETKDFVQKVIKVQGFVGMYMNNKSAKNQLLRVSLNSKAAFTFMANGYEGEKYFLGLVNKINLKKISATL